MLRIIQRFWFNLCRVCDWIPVIWNNHEFDHSYILIIMKKKLERQRDFFNSKYAMSADAKSQAKKIHVCVLLLDRLLNIDYDIVHKKPGWFGREYKYECYMEKQDLDYLCKMLNKHLFCWWD